VGVGLAGRSMDVVTEGVGNLVEYGITGSVGYHDDWICAWSGPGTYVKELSL
jgi:hypothetical protein